MCFKKFGNDFIFSLKFFLKRIDGFSECSLWVSDFSLQSSGTILKELSLPLVEKSWLNLKLIAEVSDADSVDQVATKDSNFSSAE